MEIQKITRTIVAVCFLIAILATRAYSIFTPDPKDPNYVHYRTYKLPASNQKERCNIPMSSERPKFFKLDSDTVGDQIYECPQIQDGGRSEHAVLALCNATNYPLDCGFLPYNWIAIGEDIETRCKKNISIERTFPIATFKWVKMPKPSHNFHRFYDDGHSAIFLGCMKEGGILVADQWCGTHFAVRHIQPKDLDRYFEIGSYTQNPHQFGFFKSAHTVLKNFVYRIAKTVEDTVQIGRRAYPFTHRIKEWQWTGTFGCYPEMSGPFHRQEVQGLGGEQSSLSSTVCNNSAPGNFVYETSPYKQRRYMLNLTLKNDCRLNVEVRYQYNGSLLIHNELGPGDGRTQGMQKKFCQSYICYHFEEFFFNDHGCYEGVLQLSDTTEDSKSVLFLSMPFEVCPATMTYNEHQIFHGSSFNSESGYTKSTNINVDKCADVNIPTKKHLYSEWSFDNAENAYEVEIDLFVENHHCQLQLNILDESEATTSTSMGHLNSLCGDYKFPSQFARRNCHLGGVLNDTGDIAVICYCLKWINEYTKYGDKCYEGQLVIQSNSLWHSFIVPLKHAVYPFDLCAKIRKNQPLPCEQSGTANYRTTIDFPYSRSGRRATVNVTINIKRDCRLRISLQQNGDVLQYKANMSWGYDESVPTEYSASTCNFTDASDASRTRDQICFRFAESRFENYCYTGILMLQKSLIDANNRTIPESAVPVTYKLCAPPFSSGSHKLLTTYEEQCIHVNETITRSLIWRNITGEQHEEKLNMQIIRDANCGLNLNGIWRGQNFVITFGDTNVKIEEQENHDRICFGHDFTICFTLFEQRSTNMGCIYGSIHYVALEKHALDFYRLLTEGDIHFEACPIL